MNKNFIGIIVSLLLAFITVYCISLVVNHKQPQKQEQAIPQQQDTVIFEKPDIDVACLKAMGIKQYWYLKDGDKFAFIKLNAKFQIDTNLTAKDKEIIREFLNRK